MVAAVIAILLTRILGTFAYHFDSNFVNEAIFWKGASLSVVIIIFVHFARLALRPRRQEEKLHRQPSGVGETKGYKLGEPEAQFFQVPEQCFPWLEEQVGNIYSVFESSQSASLRAPLATLRSLVKPLEQQECWLREPLDDLVLCRLLIAKDFCPQKAFELVESYLRYRSEVGGGVCPPADWISSAQVIVPFADRRGRPVVVVRAQYINPGMRLAVMTDGYRATIDAIIGYLLHRRGLQPSESNPLEQYVVVIEAENMSWHNFSYQLLELMVSESNCHYPDRLAQVYVLGCNRIVRALFGMVSPMVHPRTRKKVRLFSREEVPAFMQSLVDLAELPRAYGGRAPAWASPSQARTLHEKVGPIPAEVWQRYGVATDLDTHGAADTNVKKSLQERDNFLLDDKRSSFCCW